MVFPSPVTPEGMGQRAKPSFEKLRILLSAFSVFTGAKSFESNPLIGNAYLNRKGLHLFRMKLAARLADRYRRSLHHRVAQDRRDQYQKNGFISVENILSKQTFQSFRNEILRCHWDRQEMNQGGVITRRVWLDSGSLPSSQQHLQTLIRSEEIKDMIRYVAGTGGEPVFSLQAIFAGHSKRNNDPQSEFHSDAFHSTAKAWLFLDDVPADQGPFAYVPGSHQLTPQRLDWEHEQSCTAAAHPIRYHARGSFRATAADLKRMHYAKPRVFNVRANTLVIANTMGFHRRTPSSHPTVRVELYASLRRNPFSVFPQLDLLSLPVMRNRIGSIYCSAMTWGNRLLGSKRPWKDAGEGLLQSPPKKRSRQRS